MRTLDTPPDVGDRRKARGSRKGDTRGSGGIRIDIRLSGVGGQGLILAGLILGEAATVHGSLHAVQTRAYAPLARGAPSRSDVIISDAPVEYPQVEQADILVALAPQAWHAHVGMVAPHGFILVEESVTPAECLADARVRPLPLAREAALAGAPRGGATVMALAVVARISDCVSDQALRQSVAQHVPPESREANLAALERGFALWEAAGRPRHGQRE